MTKQDYVEVFGKVTASLPNATFKVILDPPLSREMVCYISGKIRKNYINIVPGDRVTVELSVIDPTKGRIIFRSRN